MIRMLDAPRVNQRVATVLGSVLVALAPAVALPGHATAATVDWHSDQPRLTNCSGYRYVPMGAATVTVRDCLKTYISSGRITYYNGVLEVGYYNGRSAMLGGQSMTAHRGSSRAEGVNVCPPVRFTDEAVRWCYSPTQWKPRGAGQIVYGKGILTDSTGRWMALAWSTPLEIY